VLPDFATGNVTIRRAQNFKGFPNNTDLCWSNIHDGVIIQHGTIKQKYKGNKPKSLTIKNLKIYADTIRLRVEICNPLKSFANGQLPIAANNDGSIFPNPFNDELSISIDAETDQQVTIQIADISGRIINETASSLTKGSNFILLNQLQDLATGVYIVKVNTGHLLYMTKAVKK
jgi:hypothetical protein